MLLVLGTGAAAARTGIWSIRLWPRGSRCCGIGRSGRRGGGGHYRVLIVFHLVVATWPPNTIDDETLKALDGLDDNDGNS